jgi:hypothetical protein
MQFDFLEALKLVDDWSEGQIEVSPVGVDRFHPIGLRECNRSEDSSVLTESRIEVFFAVSESLGGLMQFDIACYKDRPRVRRSEWCEAFDQLKRLERQLPEGGFGIDMQSRNWIRFTEFVSNEVAKGSPEFGDPFLFDTQSCRCCVTSASDQGIATGVKSLVQVDDSRRSAATGRMFLAGRIAGDDHDGALEFIC